jgi:hypothetical protein
VFTAEGHKVCNVQKQLENACMHFYASAVTKENFPLYFVGERILLVGKNKIGFHSSI